MKGTEVMKNSTFPPLYIFVYILKIKWCSWGKKPQYNKLKKVLKQAPNTSLEKRDHP